MKLHELRTRFPWPKDQPCHRPQWHGWLAGPTADALRTQCPANAQLIVECGSWAGLSARLLLELAPQATLICIDHWCQTPEQIAPLAPPPEAVPLLPIIYDIFCTNHWENRHRIIPVRLDSCEGLSLLASLGLKPDFIYLDSNHSTEYLLQELRLCEPFPGARIVGDDFTHESVRTAVYLRSQETGYSFGHNPTAFWSLP